jgi:ankyrin repeat protein
MGTRKPSRNAVASGSDARATSRLLTAIRNGELQKARAFLKSHPGLVSARADDGSSLLLFALYNGQTAIAALIRSMGAVLSIYDACAAGDRDRTQELLAEDPRLIGFVSHDGWTPLHLASFFGHTTVVEFLLDHGADMHVVSKNSDSAMPLHSALANRQVETAKLLIDRGADFDARQTTYEYAPLHYAAGNGLEEIVRKLLELGAKRTVEGLDGKRPIDLARANGHQAIISLLEQP